MNRELTKESQANLTLVRQVKLEREYFGRDTFNNLWARAAVRAARQSNANVRTKQR